MRISADEGFLAAAIVTSVTCTAAALRRYSRVPEVSAMAANHAAALRGHPQPRRWRRLRIDLPVRILRRQTAAIHGRGTELNGGGMRVFGVIDLSVGDVIALEFALPYWKQLLRLRAVVRNRSGYTYGLEFIIENDADYKAAGQLDFILAKIQSCQS